MIPGVVAAGAMGQGSDPLPPGGTPTFVGAGTPADSTGSISLDWPAGHAAGDYGIIFIECVHTTIPTAPSGWTLIGQRAYNNVQGTQLAIFGKFAASSSESNVSVPAMGDHTVGIMLAYRGVNVSTPIDVIAGGDGSTSSIVLPAVTTTGDNRLVIHAVADGRDNTSARYTGWTNASLTSLTERADFGGASGNGGGLGVADGEFATAGTTSAGSVTYTLAAHDYVAITLALRPV